MDEILTVGEVAVRLKMGERTIYAMLAAGELPGFKIRGQWRLRRSQFEEWLESLGAGAPVEPQKGRKGPEPQIADDATLAEAGQTFLTPRLDVPTMQVRFVDALGKSVVTHSDLDKKPLEMTLKHPLPEKVRVYLFNATRPAGGRPLGEHKIQLILPNQPRGERGSLDHSDGRFVILAGYSAEDDVFILWDAGLYRDFAYSRNVQVKAETIVQATGGSIAVQRRTLRPVGGEMVTEEVLAASSADLASAIQRRLELSLERHRG